MEEIQKQINELMLRIQNLEAEVDDLKNGNFGTGIYLDGCTEADSKYIAGNKEQKEGK